MIDRSRRRRWRLIGRGLLRALAISVVMVACYYLLPLNRLSGGYLILGLVLGMLLLSGLIVWELRAIVRSDYPGIRGMQALATATPFFLLLFASSYFTLSTDNPGTFSEALTRSDALYLTITIFSTVGFGDITPQAETARLVVSVQMLLDLVVLGLGIQAILGAVQRGRESQQSGETES